MNFKHRFGTIGIALVSFLLIIHSAPTSLNTSNMNDSDYYKLEPRGVNTLDLNLGWVATGKNSALMFATDYASNWSDPRRVLSVQLKTPNKTKRAKTLLTVDGRVLGGCALTYRDLRKDATPESAAAIGLLFIAYYPWSDSNQVNFAVVPFDAKGKKTANSQVIKTVDTEDGSLLTYKASIFATVEEKTVAVTFSATMRSGTWPPSIAWTKAFFVETDENGTTKYEPVKVKLPNKGEQIFFELFHPVQYKNRWLIPGRSVTHKKTDSKALLTTEPTGSSLYTLRAKSSGTKPARLKLTKIEDDEQINLAPAYDGVQFFIPNNSNTATSAQATKKLVLLYLKRTYFPEGSEDPRDYTTDLFGRYVKITGRALKANSFNLPGWEPQLKRKEDDQGSSSHEIISRVIVNKNGTPFIGMVRSQRIIRARPSLLDRGDPANTEHDGVVNIISPEFELFVCQMVGEQEWDNAYSDRLTDYQNCIINHGLIGFMYVAQWEEAGLYAYILLLKMWYEQRFEI